MRSMKTLADRLRWAREKQGYSCAGLDEMADLSCGHTALIESGKRESPSAETASKLAHALGVDVAWLIDGGARPALDWKKVTSK